MEQLGEILRARLSSRIATGPDGTDTLSDTEPSYQCQLCKDRGFVRLDVPFGHPDFGRAIPCDCIRRDYDEQQHDRLVSYSNLGPLARLTFDNLIEDGRSPDPHERERYRQACGIARRYADEPSGWIVLSGASGCGKTHLAAAIANRQIDRGNTVFFTFVPDLLDHLRSTFGPTSEVRYDELFETVRSAPLLILDDFGSHWSTPWAQEKLYQIINYRYSANSPTIITLGCDLVDLPERFQTRLTDPEVSRIIQLEESRSGLLQRIGGMDLPLLTQMTFASFDCDRVNLSEEESGNLQKSFEIAQNFAESPDGWLVLVGQSGCGKTHLAVAIANERQRQRQPVIFLVVPDLLDYLRSTFAPDSKVAYDRLFEEIRTTPLLILDDLGAQVSSPWAQEKLYQIINYRYNARLPTVITTNTRLEDLERRLASRLMDHRLSLVFAIAAPDYRADQPPPRPKPAARPGRPYRPGN
ncbi:MAG TPA: ATP-binding protein [Dehalococcoidia bacterium]|nr:ATP-binding protein [Dehalococcoidia bacterium]